MRRGVLGNALVPDALALEAGKVGEQRLPCVLAVEEVADMNLGRRTVVAHGGELVGPARSDRYEGTAVRCAFSFGSAVIPRVIALRFHACFLKPIIAAKSGLAVAERGR